MAIDVELKTLKQNNTSWPLTFKASNRFPIVANRVFATLEKAQQYIDDTAADASAYPGIVLAVVQDTIAKNNGVYYVQSVAMAEGETGTLVKVGGTETETATTYSAAVTLSQTLVTGQLIKITSEETIGDNKYKAGFYIVETPGTISALDTSTGAADEVGALKTRVDNLEANRVLVTDFETYKGEVTGNLATKANAQDLSTHTTNSGIHVTVDDKAKWNNAASASTKNTDDIANLTLVVNSKADASALAGYIKTEDAYDDTEVRGLITAETDARTEAISALTDIVDTKVSKEDFDVLTGTVESNYNTLSGLISNETTARTDAISALTDNVNTKASNDDLTAHTGDTDIHVTADDKTKWNDAAEKVDIILSGTGVEDVIDTFIDFNNWLTVHGNEVTGMQNAISANTDSITALTNTVNTISGKVDTNAEAIIENKNNITALTNDVNDISGKVEENIINITNLTSSATTLQDGLSALENIVGTEEGNDGIFAKLSALASGKLTVDAKVNGVSFENGEANVHAGHVALEKAITRTGSEGENEEVYAPTNSIQSVLASLSHRIDVLDPNVSGELGITSIVDGTGISTSTSGGQATISIKKSTKLNNAVVLETDGLYVQAITIDGSDVESTN